eukprot:UN08237
MLFTFSVEPLATQFMKNMKSLDGVLELIKLRIEAENQFSSTLRKIILNYDTLIPQSSESTKINGLNAIFGDIKNEYIQHKEFSKSLSVDVYTPLYKMKQKYVSRNKSYCSDLRSINKVKKVSENQFIKIKEKYDKSLRESNVATTQLITIQNDVDVTPKHVMKLSQKVNSTIKTQQLWKDRYIENEKIFNMEQNMFNKKMSLILNDMQKMKNLKGKH